MITIFATPKPFIGHNRIIQENAIKSWKLLDPECEVILLGDEPGTYEAATTFNCKHIPNVECNEYGTPLIRSLFYESYAAATNAIICYANCDIMFTKTLIETAKILQNKKKYLLVGQRYNVDINTPWDFNRPDWESSLTEYVMKNGELNPPRGIDYFMFPRGLITGIPELTVGRSWWDNWMLYNARRNFIPLIDGTELVFAVHQNHDYSHCEGGLQAAYYDGPEVQKNLSYVGNGEVLMTVAHAEFVIRDGRVVFDCYRFRNHLNYLTMIMPYLKRPAVIVRKILGLA